MRIGHGLQFKDFRLIQAIHDTGQLALAADQLSMTQPAASRMLANIETTVGTPVFIRHPKGMQPTAVGEILARNARGLLSGLDQALLEVSAVGAGRAGSAHVGSVTGGALAFVVPAVQTLKRQTVGADIHIDVASSDRLMDGLLGGDYDFILSRIPAGTDSRQFIIRRGRTEVVQFLVRRGHPLAGRTPVRLCDLAGFDWVCQAPHTPLRQAVETALVAEGFPLPDEIVNSTSLLVMLSFLVSSNAIAPVSREVASLMMAGTRAENLEVIDLASPIVVNPYHLISRKNHLISPLAERLRDLIGDAIATPPEA